jgi:hypothetical protein
MKYPKGIHVIFNSKAYANEETMKQWARQDYKWHGAFSSSDNKPRLLFLMLFWHIRRRKTMENSAPKRTLLQS